MKKFNLRYSSVALSMAAMTALASNNVYAQDEELEEVVVIGTRATIQSAIEDKRIQTQISDGLTSDEIGDIPALSIGEALETITGASSNRENGGASEVSIRGLGPFLTSTVINGREATNGAGNRAVNFSIFPSELFNKIGIFKTQSANFIEGAVAGQIRLETKSPIEHGKRSIQLNLKGAFNENEQDIRGGQDIGYRGTASYIDQFETENFGTFGVSLGVQIRDETNPEQEYTRSNTPRVCALTPDGIPNDQTCQDDELFLRGAAAADITNDGVNNPVFANDENRENFAFLSSSAQFRQNITEDERNAFFGAFQWQPNDRLDINLDAQFSERIQGERRSDLVFAEINRNINNDDTVISEDGILQSFISTGQEIQLIGQDFERDEEYNGVGLKVEYQVNEDLTVSGDISWSNTLRVEQEESLRLGDEIERTITANFTDDVGTFTDIVNTVTGEVFDASDLGEFLSGATETGEGSTQAAIAAALGADLDADDRIRARTQEDIRENTITALRGDFELQTADKLGWIQSVEGGVRFSELEYERRGNVNTDVTFDALTDALDAQFQANGLSGDAAEAAAVAATAAVLADVANNCIDTSFEDRFGEVSGAQNDALLDFNSIDAGCSLDIFDQAITDLGFPAGALDPSTSFNGSSIDVEESTFAAYLQANYESTLFGLPARGNFGVRVVNTRVDSRTFNSPFTLDFNDNNGGGNASFEIDTATNPNSGAVAAAGITAGDFLTEINDSFSYTEILPSATIVLDLSDTVLLRGGVFRGLSRSDPAILGARQQVGSVQTPIADTVGIDITPEDVAGFLTAQGQAGGAADLAPFTSWNVDLALEWYPNKDTILAAGVYYKKFRGGFQNTFIDSDFRIVSDGSGDTNAIAANLFGADNLLEITAPISSIETTDEGSNLYGIELTASHAFSYLPGFLGGFGAKLSWNYASSDFEFEDDFAGEGVSADGSELIGLIPPADIFGLSRNVASAQLYWSGGAFDFQLIGKHRSQYFQQFVDTPGRIRFVDDNTVVEFRASYKVNDAIRLSFEALNLTDEPRTDFRGVDGNVSQVLSFGPRYFFGIRAKL